LLEGAGKMFLALGSGIGLSGVDIFAGRDGLPCWKPRVSISQERSGKDVISLERKERVYIRAVH